MPHCDFHDQPMTLNLHVSEWTYNPWDGLMECTVTLGRLRSRAEIREDELRTLTKPQLLELALVRLDIARAVLLARMEHEATHAAL